MNSEQRQAATDPQQCEGIKWFERITVNVNPFSTVPHCAGETWFDSWLVHGGRVLCEWVVCVCVCCSRYEQCRAVWEQVRRRTLNTSLPTWGRQLRQASNRLHPNVRQISHSGSLQPQHLHSRSVLHHSSRRRSRVMSNADDRSGWVRLPAAKQPRRRNWRTVHFSRNNNDAVSTVVCGVLYYSTSPTGVSDNVLG